MPWPPLCHIALLLKNRPLFGRPFTLSHPFTYCLQRKLCHIFFGPFLISGVHHERLFTNPLGAIGLSRRGSQRHLSSKLKIGI